MRSVLQSQLAMAALQAKIAGALARGFDVTITIMNARMAAPVNV